MAICVSLEIGKLPNTHQFASKETIPTLVFEVSFDPNFESSTVTYPSFLDSKVTNLQQELGSSIAI